MPRTVPLPFPRALLIAAAVLCFRPGSWAEETITLTVDRDVICVGEAITGSASLNYYGGGNRPSVSISPVLPENQVPDNDQSTKHFSFQTSDSTTPGDYIVTATAEGAYPATRTVKVIKLEVEINNTSSAYDDVVFWYDQIVCHNRFEVPARIRQVPASGSSASAVDVTLSNSRSALDYAESGGWTKNLSLNLPQDGEWIYFRISGALPSVTVGDNPVEVTVSGHSGICYKKPMSVFWFIGKLEPYSGDPYAATVDGAREVLAPISANAMVMDAYADIRPEGLNATAPQIAELRIAIVQNVRSALRTATYDGPVPFLWKARYKSGQLATFPAALLATTTLPGAMLDSAAGRSPLYDAKKEKPRNHGGGTVSTEDSPSFKQPLTRNAIGRAADGRTMAKAAYDISAITMNDTYRAWCVVYNTRTKVLRPLQQADWSLTVSDTNPGPAEVGGGVEAHDCPISTPPFANDSDTTVVTPSQQTVQIPKP